MANLEGGIIIMPLTFAPQGTINKIKQIKGKDDTRRF